MNNCKIKAALVALKEFRVSSDRRKALGAYDLTLSQLANSKSAKDGCIDDDDLEVLLARMGRVAARYHSGLSADQAHSHLLRECDILLSDLSALFGIIRRLNGGLLPSDELYDLESATQELGC